MRSRRAWLLAVLATIAVAIVATLLLFDWNWVKGPLGSRISSRLGRPVEIAGDLDVDLGLRPRITVQDVRLANAPWASEQPMLAVPRAEFVVDLGALFHGRLVLPEVNIGKPELRLETRPDGPPNWKLKEGPSEGPAPIPEIGRLQIAEASIRYLDHGSGRNVALNLDHVAGSTGHPTGGGMALTAAGALADQPLTLELSGPPVAGLATPARPYPVAIDLKLGASDLAGTVTLDLGKDVPGVSATLHSDQLQTAELAGLVGAAPGPSAPAKGAAPERVMQQALNPDLLPRVEAELEYTIGELTGPDLSLQDVKLEAGLHHRLPSLTLEGGGSFKGQPVMLDVQAGPTQGATLPQPRYRIDADIAAGQTRLSVSGGVDDPERVQGLHVEFALESSDLAEVLKQAGIELPKLPGLQAKGLLTHEGDRWRLRDLYAKVGESDVSGGFEVDLSRARPFLSADLHSDRLRGGDLIPAPADREDAKDAAVKAAAKLPAILTPSGVNLDALPEVDANLKFQGDYVQAPEVVFDQLQLVLKLRARGAVVDATGKGRFRDFEPVNFEVHAGSDESLKDPEARYPIDFVLQAGDSEASARGTVDHPLDYTGLDIDVRLQGQDLRALGKLLKRPLPATSPYNLKGKISHQPDHQRWNLVAIRGTVGDSDLEGDVSIELSGPRPTLVADLKSKRLDFDDLGIPVGAPPNTQPGETASVAQRQEAAAAMADPHLLPDKAIKLAALGAIDARVRFDGEAVQARRLPLQNLSLELTLKDGQLHIEPLRLQVADGELEGVIDLERRNQMLDGSFDLSLKQIKLDRLLSRFDIKAAEIQLDRESVGTLGGRAQLTAHGNSIHDLAATADGELALVMGAGQINALIIEAIGLDIGEALGLLLTEKDSGSTMVPMQCSVARFDVKNGVMAAKALVIETSDSTITGNGQINLGKETLALELLAHPKDASVLTASTPVRIEGTFKHPKVNVISEELKEKSLAALALGVVMPVIGAILPFVETGESRGSNCGQLLEAARAAMAPAPADAGR